MSMLGRRKYRCDECKVESFHHWIERNRAARIRCPACGSARLELCSDEAKDELADRNLTRVNGNRHMTNPHNRPGVKVVGIILVALLFVAPLSADPPTQPAPVVPAAPAVVITAPADAKVGQLVSLSYKFTGDATKWKFAGDSVQVIREFEPDPNTVRFRLFSEKPARVIFSAVSADKAGGLSEITDVEIPIGITPPPPPPEDESKLTFPTKLKRAFAKETAADKGLIADLAALYTQAAAAKGIVHDPNIKTAGALHDKLKAARESLIGESLPNVRKVVTAEFDSKLTTQSTAVLDASTRASIAAEFLKIGDALGGLKP